MPIHEFLCQACEHPFEELVRNDREPVACPQCGSQQVRRQLSVFGVGAAGKSAQDPIPTGPCGRCGNPAGSCAMD